MNFRLFPPFALPLLMLGVPLAGSLASVLRGVLMGSEDGLSLLVAAALLVLPVAVMTALCIWASQRNKGAAWGAGLLVVIVATVLNFGLLMPQHSPDIGTPLTLYILFGWLFPLLPVALLGGVVGAALWPEPQQTRRRALPLKPWLWPIVLPLLALIVVALRMDWIESQEFVPLLVIVRFLTTSALLLGFMLLPLALLRVKANRTLQAQPV